jgi:hypothetical protein
MHELDEAYSVSRARTWRALEKRVALRFGLRLERERFKTSRACEAAQACARRLLGQLPMVDVYRSKQEKQRNVSLSKVMKCLESPSEAEIAEGITRSQVSQMYFQPEWFEVSVPRLQQELQLRYFVLC